MFLFRQHLFRLERYHPLQRALVDAMLSSSAHIIATMRTLIDYVQEKGEKTGCNIIRKVGMALVQRQGIEYEFQVVADMDIEHNLVIAKTRCNLLDGLVVNNPTTDFFKLYADWLRSSASDPNPLKSIPSDVKLNAAVVKQPAAPMVYSPSHIA